MGNGDTIRAPNTMNSPTCKKDRPLTPVEMGQSNSRNDSGICLQLEAPSVENSPVFKRNGSHSLSSQNLKDCSSAGNIFEEMKGNMEKVNTNITEKSSNDSAVSVIGVNVAID